LAWRHEIGDGRLRQHHQTAGAEALQAAEQDQPGHRACESAQRRTGDKDQDRDDKEWPPPVHVAELAVKWRRRRRGQHESRDHPRQMGEPAELADDARQCGADNVLVERGQRHGGQ
jgi:hypothetical protein